MSSTNNNVTPASIAAGFPIQTLTPLAASGLSIPTYSSLVKLQRELNSNATSQHTNRGDGDSGFLVLSCPPAVFAALPGYVAFITPNNPGQSPTIPAGSTAERIRVIMQLHANELQDFNQYHAVDKALKQLLLAACPQIFLNKLQHPTLGFARVSTLAMMTHLWTTYGQITPGDILSNNQEMTKICWRPPKPIEELFARITEFADFATAGGAPISDLMIVQTAYMNLELSGLFTDDCKVWRGRDPAVQTYAHLVDFFTRADLDRNRVTAAAAGYHSANSAVVATATELLNLQAKVANLEKQLAARPAAAQRRTHTVSNADAAVAARLLANTSISDGEGGRSGGERLSYCWTHGSSTNSRHTSATCNNKAEFHQDGATLADKMGGSEYAYTAADRLERRPRGHGA